MDGDSLRAMAVIVGSVFVAELADKTQIATLTFAASSSLSKFQVWIAASLGLILATGLAVIAAELLGPLLKQVDTNRIGGLIFLAIGGWMLIKG